MTWHELLSLTPELKKKIQSVLMFLKELVYKAEKLTNYNSDREIFMTCSQFY